MRIRDAIITKCPATGFCDFCRTFVCPVFRKGNTIVKVDYSGDQFEELDYYCGLGGKP